VFDDVGALGAGVVEALEEGSISHRLTG
jgi:hypothetical protein